MEKVRLSKVMSARGLCSRREADRYIEQGLVEVDGEIIDQLGYKIDESQSVRLLKSAQEHQDQLETILINKPIGYVSNLAEDGHLTALTLIKPENYFGEDQARRVEWKGLAPAGRLDIDSQGLLVMTKDGRIARQIIDQHSQIEKEYLIWVDADVSEEALEQLRFGLSLDGKPLKRARIKRHDSRHLQFILREGKNRQIRRMCDLVDIKVTRLMRIRIGRVRLGDLPPGRWRFLKKKERF